MLPSQLLTARTPSTRGTLLSLTCTNSTPPTFECRWWLFLKSIPFPSPAIWIKNPTNVWLKMECIFTTMILMRRLAGMARLLTFERESYVTIFFQHLFLYRLSMLSRIWCASIGNFILCWTKLRNCDFMLSQLLPSTTP